MRKRTKRKTDKINKITSMQDKAQDRKMSITLMDNPLTDKNNTDDRKMNNLIERTESEENLFIAIKETENLKNKLKAKKEELEKNKKKDENDLLTINQNIKDKSIKLENVSNNTKKLLNNLNLLNKEINEGYNKVKVFQVFNKIKTDYMNNLKTNDKKRVNQGKKIILLNNKIIDKYKIHKEKLQKIIEEDKDLKLNSLKQKLEELTKYEKDLTKDVENLRLMKKNHEKKCLKTNEELNIILERIKKEYDDEINLKNNNNNNKTISYQRKDSYSSIQSLPKIINAKNLTIQTNENNPIPSNILISNKQETNSRNYRSLTNIFGEHYFMEKDLKELKDKIRSDMKVKLNQKLKGYITSYSEQKKEKIKKENEKKNLFSKLEKDMLSKIIPKECLKIYQDKFKTIEKERFEIKERIHLNKTKKKTNEENTQLIFITEKKDINLSKKNKELNSKINNMKKKMNIILKELKATKRSLNNINDKYNLKKEENDMLKNHWSVFNDDIKNKKITIKKGETISMSELNDINRWGNKLALNINKSVNNEETCENNNLIKKIKLMEKSED